MTSDDHKTAAEQALADAWGSDNPNTELLRALTHAVLALIDEGGHGG